ncbi:uncharacterized protein BT62DRAFT_1004515 [Guyanagaster necrorhizus]|uniref:Uncharacterized protein n=1 Tax=Guyanagaster necrorhizus TaxID=856835 RepID=A0A9P7VVR2_9AGAR|nr:uncharacterized protein BT62DRAFT_1004515 [Guyanagaster necrorhizus MCA 3950]KAG7447752.1 hypothetical protein BT62DRAFT_1004515 [Guyanagaster necrorhizus MCA 3950]
MGVGYSSPGMLVLKIPWANFNKVPEDVGIPVLQPELLSPAAGFHNSFSFIQLVFGTLSMDGDLKDPSFTITQDPLRWYGASDLILMLWVPAWILCVSPKTTDVMFSHVHLCSSLTIFKTRLLDGQHAFLSRRYPSFSDASLTSSTLGKFKQVSPATSDNQPVFVKASLSNPDNVIMLSIRTNVVDNTAREALLKGHGFSHSVAFPYPIDGAKIKLRIARKSHYIEVKSFAIRAFIRQLTYIYFLHVSAPVSNQKVLDSLSFNYGSVPMLKRIVCIVNEDTNLPEIVIILRHVRLDLASHTVVIDCFVLPFTKALYWTLPVLDRNPVLTIKTHSAEIKLWKQMLPAITECCRTWSHVDNCEYLTRGIPASLEEFETPLCSCGWPWH